MLHFVASYMKQNKSRKQTLESAQYGLKIIFNLTNVLDMSKHCSLQSVISEQGYMNASHGNGNIKESKGGGYLRL